MGHTIEGLRSVGFEPQKSSNPSGIDCSVLESPSVLPDSPLAISSQAVETQLRFTRRAGLGAVASVLIHGVNRIFDRQDSVAAAAMPSRVAPSEFAESSLAPDPGTGLSEKERNINVRYFPSTQILADPKLAERKSIPIDGVELNPFAAENSQLEIKEPQNRFDLAIAVVFGGLHKNARFISRYSGNTAELDESEHAVVTDQGTKYRNWEIPDYTPVEEMADIVAKNPDLRLKMWGGLGNKRIKIDPKKGAVIELMAEDPAIVLQTDKNGKPFLGYTLSSVDEQLHIGVLHGDTQIGDFIPQIAAGVHTESKYLDYAYSFAVEQMLEQMMLFYGNAGLVQKFYSEAFYRTLKNDHATYPNGILYPELGINMLGGTIQIGEYTDYSLSPVLHIHTPAFDISKR